MPHDLLESEFFGHEAGAFTGATTKRIGLFEEASSGSLFLDEIGTMPVSLQGKLLRAIQDSEIRAVGSNEYKPIDVRIISATNSNLKESIEDKTFRDDLYYRLGVVILEVPPLRRRKDDIPLLIEHFAKRFAEKFNIPTPKLNSSLVKNLKNYPWPGNVRELENAVERALVLSEGPLSVDAFELSAAPEALLDEDELPSLHDAVSDAVKRTERELIQRALARTGGNKVKASKALGVSYKTLINKSKEYQLAQKAKPHAQDKLH